MELKNNEHMINNDKIQNLDTYDCIKCKYSTHKPSLWFKHISTIKHEKKILEPENTLPIPKEFYCDYCNVKVYHITNWNIHLNSQKHKREGKPKSIECIICNHKFINHITQKHHMLSNHSTKEERSKEKYYCEICDYVFISKLYFDRHNDGKFHKSKVYALQTLKELNKEVNK